VVKYLGMEKNNMFKMFGLERRLKKTEISAIDRKKIGTGSEVEVSRVKLRYKEFDKKIEGLVLKKLHGSEKQPDWAECQMQDILRQWKFIKRAVRRRKKEGLSHFLLPGTIRGYREGNEQGILMTDLTEGGSNQIYDLKEISIGYYDIDQATWIKIREQIERDIQMASEEKINLAGGPYPLDPWLIVIKDNEPQVYLVDIGGYTSVNVSEYTVKRSTLKLRRALEKMDADMQF